MLMTLNFTGARCSWKAAKVKKCTPHIYVQGNGLALKGRSKIAWQLEEVISVKEFSYLSGGGNTLNSEFIKYAYKIA